MNTDDDKQYDPDEDPDTGSATTPADVASSEQRDQAEGDEEAAEPAEPGS